MKAILLLASLVFSILAQAADKPNFLVIIADDLCWRDLGFTGNPDVKTPHLDKLASEGMQLRGMFNPAISCSPTRHALLTGLYPIRSGAFPNHTRVDEGTASIFTHLRALDYRTGLQGKLHIAPMTSFPGKIISADLEDFAAFKSFIHPGPRP